MRNRDHVTGCKMGLLCLTLIVAGCGNGASELTSEEKYSVDTIYNRKLIGWRTELDSFCKYQQDTLFARAVDSLMEERLAEIEMFFNETPDVQ